MNYLTNSEGVGLDKACVVKQADETNSPSMRKSWSAHAVEADQNLRQCVCTGKDTRSINLPQGEKSINMGV